jgi:hypothetical protein
MPVSGRHAGAARIPGGALELLDVDVHVEQEQRVAQLDRVGAEARLATWTAWWRLFAAASGSLSRQKATEQLDPCLRHGGESMTEEEGQALGACPCLTARV